MHTWATVSRFQFVHQEEEYSRVILSRLDMVITFLMRKKNNSVTVKSKLPP